ncbi:MAG TPA: hypothetical protein VMU88_01355, partial [bacterium]|nr:hypothetical protein [bacterium]
MIAQFKDLLQIITLLAVAYAALSRNDWVLYVGLVLLLGFLADLTLPKVLSSAVKKRKEKADRKIWLETQTILKEELNRAVGLMEQYKKLVSDQSWAHSLIQALRSNGNQSNPLLGRLSGS